MTVQHNTYYREQTSVIGSVSSFWQRSIQPFKQDPLPKTEVTASLAMLYTFISPTRVLCYIESHPRSNLTTVLTEAPKYIYAQFPDARLVLEVVTDPENPNHEQLFVNIHTVLEPQEAIEKMDHLHQDWYLERGASTGWKFNLYIEFDE